MKFLDAAPCLLTRAQEIPLMARMPHLIVLLPGITGSILCDKKGKEIWNPTHFITGIDPQQLILPKDDATMPMAPDCVRATGLVEIPFVLTGITKADGYGRLLKHIADSFDVQIGIVDAPKASDNLFAFPYDWRRDIRASARALESFCRTQLAAFRDTTGNFDAKVLLIAHSMGGLVGQYYLEVLGGHTQCAALFTLGTPFQGAATLLGSLLHRYKFAGRDLTECLRSFASIHQMLPRYPTGLSEADSNSLDQAISRTCRHDLIDAGTEFYSEMRRAVQENRNIRNYLHKAFIGIGQSTVQSHSCELPDRAISLHSFQVAPSGVQAGLEGGDGTVPMCSAITTFVPDSHRSYCFEHHALLQSNEAALLDIKYSLQILAAGNLRTLRGGPAETGPRVGPQLDVHEMTPGTITATLTMHTPPVDIRISVENQAGTVVGSEELNSSSPASSLQVTLGHFEPGFYKVLVSNAATHSHIIGDIVAVGLDL